MTVKVTLPDDQFDTYMRFGDTYLEHPDGSLEVFRTGARSLSYGSTEWIGVEGDQRRSKVRLFRR
ncbi:hypothetical protein EV589_1619 [Mycobacterium sp. BK558]|uniref:Uncharacterized protein n=1 Tax=Mycolicibacterium chlorophenolicum TaxID=37916 RepID=A0A0J6Y2R2_9MYCO|nr:hypothetical protein [Mycolicibacterium chlorophenolicum]KMO67481.1 hypothetical protein MCHLDSM_06730 [Mycolicibacterium chlorophenolicum]RZT25871.1 hypothetical protein EV589_1619 [Mycobacterium sp. BK558]